MVSVTARVGNRHVAIFFRFNVNNLKNFKNFHIPRSISSYQHRVPPRQLITVRRPGSNRRSSDCRRYHHERDRRYQRRREQRDYRFDQRHPDFGLRFHRAHRLKARGTCDGPQTFKANSFVAPKSCYGIDKRICGPAAGQRPTVGFIVEHDVFTFHRCRRSLFDHV